MAASGVTEDEYVLIGRDLVKEFAGRSGLFSRRGSHVRAVDGVTLGLKKGRTLGLVGESGSGKSTVGRLLLRLLDSTDGEILLHGEEITKDRHGDLRRARREMQMVFQDPYSSLNPTMRVGELVGEPIAYHRKLRGQALDDEVARILVAVGLSGEHARRFPDELSGGQRQRVAIARALGPSPDVLVCDEAVSALDISIQSQILNLLLRLQEELGLTILFVSHDLSVVRHVSHDIAVMYLGQIVEQGPAERVVDEPAHPYTAALLSAVPEAKPADQRSREKILLRGDPPSPSEPPQGCPFASRCPVAFEPCDKIRPEHTAVEGGGTVACHLQTAGPVLAGRPVPIELLSRAHK
ncbi:ABC transporter ATP-binding protein [Microbacterium sp.]|uniref:ABC transporter ATP-binding protein n=1 Tax=Microbacterium sp. TaxID=51671 RepID=UPI000C4EAE63|nr:oligopeptide/dipeptide ABC transporter ATP-binding protein [Microbacterium sp.]MBU19044.1 oligopeptide ABC transporter ATP-binding protein [Microbacterium sp.]|tara:strand:- start:5741 stop:6796 length:1056 start_codon:yes stop_codon:yes gene_type:complete